MRWHWRKRHTEYNGSIRLAISKQMDKENEYALTALSPPMLKTMG
jgi:hypothetical protein